MKAILFEDHFQIEQKRKHRKGFFNRRCHWKIVTLALMDCRIRTRMLSSATQWQPDCFWKNHNFFNWITVFAEINAHPETLLFQKVHKTDGLWWVIFQRGSTWKRAYPEISASPLFSHEIVFFKGGEYIIEDFVVALTRKRRASLVIHKKNPFEAKPGNHFFLVVDFSSWVIGYGHVKDLSCSTTLIVISTVSKILVVRLFSN